VALLNAGAFFGALAPALLGHKIGRRRMLSVAAIFLLIGGIIQSAAQPPNLAWLYGGRVISGFGVGMVSNLTPVYVAETAPKELRGLLMGMFEMFLVSGGLLAYWTTYGCSLHLAPTPAQWRVPLSLQIILAAIVLGGSFFIVESPRWLAKKGRWEEVEKSLSDLRGCKVDSPELKNEIAEIRAQIEHELQLTSGRSIMELLERKNFVRLSWGCGVSFFSIWCGHNGILYYGPLVFKQIGFTGQDASLFASGMFTVVKFVITVVFLLFVVQRFNRTPLLSFGSAGMAIVFFALAAVLAMNPIVPGTTVNDTHSGRSMVRVPSTLITVFI
jgi:sugar porter (SP) family MFS transporter